jgi:hypothetical protein
VQGERDVENCKDEQDFKVPKTGRRWPDIGGGGIGNGDGWRLA